MIVVDLGDSLRCVTQGDHAHFAADLLSLCRFPDLERHRRRGSLLEAVRQHDNGWREFDAAPWLDPQTGAPYAFERLPEAQRREIWTRATRRYLADDPTVALLITQHALALHQDRSGDEAWDNWLAE